jgi:predicted ribosome quality control (RQC) complex YloA/Tae2 family protein
MTLSAAEIRTIVADLRPKLEGGRIERIDQPDRHRLILHVRNGPSRYWLLICTHPRFSRLHLLPRRPVEGKAATGFGNVVRQHMTATPLRSLRQMPDDRIVIIEAIERDRLQRTHRVSLVAELTGPRSNLLLLDESDRILGALRRGRREGQFVGPGADYKHPPAPDKLPDKAKRNRFLHAADAEDALSISRAVEAHYAPLEAAERIAQLRSGAEHVLSRALRRTRGRLAKITAELAAARDAESILRKGELLKIALPQLKPGLSQITVEDLFDPSRGQLTIELDPARSPQQNVSQLFRRYKKAKSSRDRLAARLEKTRHELSELEGLLGLLEDAATPEQLASLKAHMQAAGLRFPQEKPRPPARAEPRGPRKFISSDGLEILVGRNGKENDRLTFTIARGNDFWVHLLGESGPHVIIRKPPDGQLTREALLDAAHLAVHFSKMRGAGQAEVVYTQAKNVRRASGRARGRVNYADATTLQVRCEQERIERLTRSPGP